MMLMMPTNLTTLWWKTAESEIEKKREEIFFVDDTGFTHSHIVNYLLTHLVTQSQPAHSLPHACF